MFITDVSLNNENVCIELNKRNIFSNLKIIISSPDAEYFLKIFIDS
jgi:hypothetical protein